MKNDFEKVVVGNAELYLGDCLNSLREMPEKSVQCCVTSPPYFGLRDYGNDGQIGLEQTPEEFIGKLVDVFREVRRVLADDGTLWLNMGDCYAKNKNRLMIPARLALALQVDKWVLRDEVVWHKPRTTPAPVTDRTVAAHEMIYLLAKSPRYFYDWAAIEEPALNAGAEKKHVRSQQSVTPGESTKYSGRKVIVRDKRRKRSVWSISPSPYKGAHFATFPPDLIEPCILAGSRPGDTVLDPFNGSGTTGLVAVKHGRRYVGCELNPEYVHGITVPRLEAVQKQASLFV